MPLRTLIAFTAGLVLAAAFEPVGVSALMPPALAALVLCLRGAPLGRAWIPALAFGVSFVFSVMVWMRAVGTDAWLAMCAVEAAFFAPLGLVMAWSLRHRGWPLWTALWWVAVENWRSEWPFSGMPFGRLAYATADTPWAAALPWVGMTGVSLLVALSGTTLAWVLVTVRARPLLVGAGVVSLAGVVLVPVLVSSSPTEVGRFTIAVVQGNVPGSGIDVVGVHREVTANHVSATVDLAARVRAGEETAPDLVVWPENSTAVDPFTDPGVRHGIETAVAAIDRPVLVGAMLDDQDDDSRVLNQGIVWHPDTGGGDRYTKRHPVPYGEYIPFRGALIPDTYGRLREIGRDMVRGTRVEPLRVDDVLVADAICFDVAYDAGIAAQLSRGGQLLAVQTSNAMFVDTGQIAQQFEISRLRAIEGRRW
ncbi:MAG: apolipoprotein N-acyltransferase, partial [Nocardioides sp.]|nr:apolipoprotein N-acyltransferase [Nocardioides sp.]